MNDNSDNYLFTTTSSSLMSDSLLFFDTFSHSSSEQEIFDLVQFPTPVVIDLIKIVPLGQPIEANIPGNVRLGATNPSDCEIKFFINDLSQQDADKMADLGKFHCSEKETDFNPPIQVQTDGLLLRGNYRTLTLAIFGQIAVYETKHDDILPLPSAASPPPQTPASPVVSERDIPFVVSTPIDQHVIRSRDESESIGNSTIRSGDLAKEEELDEEDAIAEYSSSKDDNKEMSASKDISMNEGGLPNVFRDKKSIEQDYSNSLDNDSFGRSSIKNDDTSRLDQPNNLEANHNSETLGNRISEVQEDDVDEWTFNPEIYNPSPLLYFIDPSQTILERNFKRQETEGNRTKNSSTLEKDIKRVIDMFEFVDQNSDEWVTLMEDVANDIANLSLSEPLTSQEMIEFLVKQICHGLDLNMALKQKQTGFKVRHLKAGIRLANNLFQCGPVSVKALLDGHIPHKLIDMYDKEQMSLPVRLMIFRCLNVACDSVEALDYFINKKFVLEGTVFQLDKVEKQFIDDNSAKTDETKPPRKEDEEHDTPLDNPSRELTCYEALILILLSKPTTRALIATGNLIKKIRLFKNLSDLPSEKFRKNPKSVEDTEESSSDTMMTFKMRNIDLEDCCNLIQDIVNIAKDINNNIGQPIRYLPAELQFHIQHKPTDAHISFYRWIKYFDTLELINNLLSTSRAEIHENASNIDLERSIRLRNLCLTFIYNIVDSPCGLNFLLSENLCKTTRNILNALRIRGYNIKRPNHLRLPDELDTCVNSSVHREETLLESRSCDMYLRLVYSFKVFSCLDRLFHFHHELLRKKDVLEVGEPEKILHELYILTDHAYGLEFILKHLSTIGNLDCLLRFLDMPDNKHLEFVKETTIDFTFELIGTFLRQNNNVLTIADEYLETFTDLSKVKDKNLSVRLKSFIPWVSPFDHDNLSPFISYSDETFKNLTRVIRKSITNQTIPFANELDFELPPKLITAVRILRQLCIPPQVESYIESIFDCFSIHAQMDRMVSQSKPSSSFMDRHSFDIGAPHPTNQSWNMSFPQISRHTPNLSMVDEFNTEQINQISNLFKLFNPYDEEICGELKYHYAIMKLYEQEGLKRLLNTLRELIGNFPTPTYQSAALSGHRGRIFLSYIHSVILLLQSIVFHLMDARGSEFQDTSIIPVILEIYSLLSFVPNPHTDVDTTGDLHEESYDKLQETHLANLNKSLNIRLHNFHLAYKTKTIILSILIGYTQLCLSMSENEEKVISKSMWTKMLKEVIDFTMSNPISFIHGLDVLTKIIPAPLPSSSMMDSVDQEQLFRNINHRKLWSAHLHPLHQQIEQMISAFSITRRSDLRRLLYYFCNQLCDLSSNAAHMVVKIITDTLVHCAARLNLDSNGPNGLGVCSTSTPPEPQPANQASVINQQQQQQSSTSVPQANQLNANDDQGSPLFRNSQLLSGIKETAYVAKMIFNLLSNVITNQAFETAFGNHLQRLSKKDEKLLTNLKDTLKYHEDYRPGELVDEATNASATPQLCANTVNSFIESIKTMTEGGIMGQTKDNLDSLTPPDSLIKNNLTELSRKVCGDRFPIQSNLKRTYRLKVLLDLKSREKSPVAGSSVTSSNGPSSSSRSFENTKTTYSHSDASSAHKQSNLGPPIASYPLSSSTRGRPMRQVIGNRPDFRSRPQNTSRPPSIHVDDFNDLYGDSSSSAGAAVGSSGAGGGSSSSRTTYMTGLTNPGSSNKDNYARSHNRPAYGDYAASQQGSSSSGAGLHGDLHQHYMSPPPNQYINHRNSSYSSKPKYMKMK